MLFTENTSVPETKTDNNILEQFYELEQKIENLLHLIASLKEEKKSLLKKIDDQENNILLVYEELEKLKSGRNEARNKLTELINKINQVDINPE